MKAAQKKENMANQTVKIVGFSNGISKVEAVSGAQRGDELFVDGELGTKGDRVEVPEFRVENSDSDIAKTYYAEKATAVKVSEVHGGWNHGFAVDVTWSNSEWSRVALDRDQLVKDDGTYDDDYVSRAVEAAAPLEVK
jgi:hypothetical protein